MFIGKLDIKVISADLSAFTEDEEKVEELTTYVEIEVDHHEAGISETQGNTDKPRWEESFSYQSLDSMQAIQITVYKDLGPEIPDKMLGECFLAIKDIQIRGKDNEMIKFRQELNPKGSIKLEMTFFPREKKKKPLKRKVAVHEKLYLHKGHCYSSVFFNQPVFCAYCRNFIWGLFGKQGLSCKNCGMNVHKNHYKNTTAICKGIKEPEFDNGNRENLRINIPHNFKKHTFYAPTYCDHCGKLLMGVFKQGYQCKDCKFNAHSHCREKFANNCGFDEKTFNDYMKKLNIDPERTKSITDIPEKIPETDPEALAKFAQVLRNLDDDTIVEGTEEFEDFKTKLMKKITESETYQMAINKSKVEDFEFLNVLGEGAFGKVFLAEHKPTSKVYAVKMISKEHVIRGDDIDVTMTERRILALGATKNFLTTLHSSFQTPDRLFFVMEYVSGGDLMFLIQKLGFFTPEQTKFYAGEIFLALHFLHGQNIIYRDLKLDNVMLDKEGHIKLTDFGLCKEGIGRRDLTETFGGTPDYMAPEIIETYRYKSGGYGHAVDWWSFGVLCYEMLAGGSPFTAEEETELLDQILEAHIIYPDHISMDNQEFLEELLKKDPFSRLGCYPDSEDSIQNHPFFADIDWEALENMEVDPPFKPVVKDDKDTSNFDEEFTRETPNITEYQKQSKIEFEKFYQDSFKNFSFYNINYDK